MSLHEGMPWREIIHNNIRWIKTRCVLCGDVDVRAEQVTIHIYDEGDSFYGFSCPKCGDRIERRGSLEAFAELLTAPVDVILEDHCV